MWCLHSAGWWQRHWERTGVVSVERADTMPDGWRAWLEWQRTVAPDNSIEIRRSRPIAASISVTCARSLAGGPEVRLDDPQSVPSRYSRRPLLRAEH